MQQRIHQPRPTRWLTAFPRDARRAASQNGFSSSFSLNPSRDKGDGERDVGVRVITFFPISRFQLWRLWYDKKDFLSNRSCRTAHCRG